MAWYDEAVFYHIYPLGLTGAPRQNSYGMPEHRLNTLIPWISHIKNIGCNALYIGPLFESVGHGYETTDYRKLDSRLGTNEDLTNFVKVCHDQGVKVILDGVFNHVGRDFFAFQDVKCNREHSSYIDWFCNVNFWGNNEYNDGFSYDNWGGYNLLVKLNQRNPAVRDYICDVIRFWVKEFDIDGIRLDAADVLDFGYMQALRSVANEVKPDFWLMGEVIHGDYSRWVNEGTLHSVTNYQLHKALYSGHNDHNYFEIAHTVKRLYDMGGRRCDGLRLYNFVDNHDVERIYTKLNNKAHFTPVHILLYTLPGIPSIYYGSEFGIEGRKERGSDDSLRPALSLGDYADAVEKNNCTRLIAALGRAHEKIKALSYGDYQELFLTTKQYAFARNFEGRSAIITVNNDDYPFTMTISAQNSGEYVGVLSGEKVTAANGQITVSINGSSGDIWVPADLWEKCMTVETVAGDSTKIMRTEAASKAAGDSSEARDAAASDSTKIMGTEARTTTEAASTEAGDSSEARDAAACASTKIMGTEADTTTETASTAAGITTATGTSAEGNALAEATGAEASTTAGAIGAEATAPAQAAVSAQPAPKPAVPTNKSYEEMTIEELQNAILDRMAKNGPITDRMRQDVIENVYHNSLVNWIKSFR